jgi:hypothetical protein
METSSEDSVSIYVRDGLGVGLALRTPGLQRDSESRVLSLNGFPKLPIGVFRRGKLGEIAQAFFGRTGGQSKEVLAKSETAH